MEADATESVTDGSIDTDISETTEENRVVAFDKLKKKREKRKLKKVSDDDNFTNDEITGE